MPQADGVDNDGDGVADEAGEDIDLQSEFVQYPPVLGGFWPFNDDAPFGQADLNIIVQNAPPTGADPSIKAIINDVFLSWAGSSGIGGYGPGIVANDDYFELMRHIFTTYNSEYIGAMTPVNHLNLLDPLPRRRRRRPRRQSSTATATASSRECARFDGDGGIRRTGPADNTAWQVLANLIDYLDNDLATPYDSERDAHRLSRDSQAPRLGRATDATTDVTSTASWTPASPVALFFGTERQPLHQRDMDLQPRNDRVDNDGDGFLIRTTR